MTMTTDNGIIISTVIIRSDVDDDDVGFSYATCDELKVQVDVKRRCLYGLVILIAIALQMLKSKSCLKQPNQALFLSIVEI